MKRLSISPVLIELLVVVLFFAICASINVQVLARADALSRESERESAALIAVTDMCESIKASPEKFCQCDGGDTCFFETDTQGLTLKVSISNTRTESGAFYDFTVSAFEDEKELAVIRGGSYRKGTQP